MCSHTLATEGLPARTDAMMSRSIGATALYVNSANATGGALTVAPIMCACGDCCENSAEKSAPANGALEMTDSINLERLAMPPMPFLKPPEMCPSRLVPPSFFLPSPPPSSCSRRRRRCGAPCSRYFSAPVSNTLTHRVAPKRPTTCDASPTTARPCMKLRSMAPVIGRPRMSMDGVEEGKTRLASHSTASQKAWLAA